MATKEPSSGKTATNTRWSRLNSSASHPFYTGKHKVIDTSGRIDKFQKRYAR